VDSSVKPSVGVDGLVGLGILSSLMTGTSFETDETAGADMISLLIGPEVDSFSSCFERLLLLIISFTFSAAGGDIKSMYDGTELLADFSFSAFDVRCAFDFNVFVLFLSFFIVLLASFDAGLIVIRLNADSDFGLWGPANDLEDDLATI
jgi:hypothetical protein